MSRGWQAVAATGVIGVATAVGLAVVPVAGSFVGAFAGAFLLGVAADDRPIVPAAVGAVVARLGVLAAPLVLAGPVSLPTTLDPLAVAVAVGVSAAVGGFGAHFGDDLRAGFAEPVETPGRSAGDSPRVERNAVSADDAVSTDDSISTNDTVSADDAASADDAVSTDDSISTNDTVSADDAVSTDDQPAENETREFALEDDG